MSAHYMYANLTLYRKCMTFAQLKFVDVHVHLSDPEYKEMIDVLMDEAEQSSVVALVSNSMNLRTSQLSLQLAEKHKGRIYAALGIHPWNVKDLTPQELEETAQLILDHTNDTKMVAIGEVGLDPQYLEKAKNKAELQELQHKVFHEMLKIAEKTCLPTIIHSRGATQQIVEMLPSYNVKKVLLHWFSKPLELLPEIVSRGYYISEGPPAAYSKSTKEIIKQTPLENLLTETDGPVRYSGKPFKGKTTTPAFIPTIVKAMANTKGMKKDEVTLQIYKNFAAFFKIKV
jgi:TatD DNase family protein